MLFGLEWVDVLTIVHVAAAAMGVGSATASDSVFLRAIRNRLITSGQFLLITSVSDVVLTGLVGVVLTGAALVVLTPAMLTEPGFQAKMIVVGVLLLNGIGFHARVIPYLEEHRDVRLDDEALSRRVQIGLAGSGTLSAVSWYGALVLGVMPNVGWPLVVFLAIYGAMLIGAVVIASAVLGQVTPELDDREKLRSEHQQEHGGTRWEIPVIGLLLVIVVAAIVIALVRIS